MRAARSHPATCSRTKISAFCSRDVYCVADSRRECQSTERRRFDRMPSQLRGFMKPLQERGGPLFRGIVRRPRSSETQP